MPDRYFVLKGCAGLGNRLITLSWAVRYCMSTGRTLIVDWADGQFAPKGTNLFPDFFRLENVSCLDSWRDIPDWGRRSVYPESWKHSPDASVYDLYNEVEPYPTWKRRTLKLGTLGRWSVSGVWRLRPDLVKHWAYWAYLPLAGPIRTGRLLPAAADYPKKMKEDVLFGAEFLPAPDKETLVKNLVIAPEKLIHLRSIAQQLNIGENTLGIHVRGTDRGADVDVDHLISLLRQEVTESDRSLFLATDSVQILARFQREFPGRLVFFEKYLPDTGNVGLHQWGLRRESSRLVQIFEESLVDLYLLSRCGSLWRHGESSFSALARIWGRPGQTSINWLKA